MPGERCTDFSRTNQPHFDKQNFSLQKTDSLRSTADFSFALATSRRCIFWVHPGHFYQVAAFWILQADIEIGNGLPEIRTGQQVEDALKSAGFEVLNFSCSDFSVQATKSADICHCLRHRNIFSFLFFSGCLVNLFSSVLTKRWVDFWGYVPIVVME